MDREEAFERSSAGETLESGARFAAHGDEAEHLRVTASVLQIDVAHWTGVDRSAVARLGD